MSERVTENDIRSCRYCGCTDDNACLPTCSWAGPDVCSSCVATLGGRRFPDSDPCAHCRAPVHITRYALGEEVEHFDPAASWPSRQKGTAWRECRGGTVATIRAPRPR